MGIAKESVKKQKLVMTPEIETGLKVVGAAAVIGITTAVLSKLAIGTAVSVVIGAAAGGIYAYRKAEDIALAMDSLDAQIAQLEKQYKELNPNDALLIAELNKKRKEMEAAIAAFKAQYEATKKGVKA